METLQKKSLFWDVEKLDPQNNANFIIARILNFGDLEDFKWMINYYGRDKIKNCLITARSLTKKSFSFWCRYFNIDPKQCILMQSPNKQSPFWKR